MMFRMNSKTYTKHRKYSSAHNTLEYSPALDSGEAQAFPKPPRPSFDLTCKHTGHWNSIFSDIWKR